MKIGQRGNRKFEVALLWWAAATVALFWGKISGAEYVTICGLDVGLYMGGNVGSKWAGNGKSENGHG